ncbi:MAG: hypothetical protein P8Y58_04125 [Novosphingobium sp.]
MSDSHFEYVPSEKDRISDGRRVDHVPALTLIDIAASVEGVVGGRGDISGLSAEFLAYADPRAAFDIFRKNGRGSAEFFQKKQLVATVRCQ